MLDLLNNEFLGVNNGELFQFISNLADLRQACETHRVVVVPIFSL